GHRGPSLSLPLIARRRTGHFTAADFPSCRLLPLSRSHRVHRGRHIVHPTARMPFRLCESGRSLNHDNYSGESHAPAWELHNADSTRFENEVGASCPWSGPQVKPKPVKVTGCGRPAETCEPEQVCGISDRHGKGGVLSRVHCPGCTGSPVTRVALAR